MTINIANDSSPATKAISGEEYTQLAGLFVHFLRCKKGYIACYAPLLTPRQLLLRRSTSCIHAVVEINKNPAQFRFILSRKSPKDPTESFERDRIQPTSQARHNMPKQLRLGPLKVFIQNNPTGIQELK
jgi:hypothetical protein